jgi:hypothetical protein
LKIMTLLLQNAAVLLQKLKHNIIF